MGLHSWNPARICERCQMNATGVMPDTMSAAADLLIQKMHEHDVELTKRAMLFTARSEEAPPSMIETLIFSAVEGRKKRDHPPLSPLQQEQSGNPATKQSIVTVATAEPLCKRACLDASHETCSEPTCQRSHFRSTKFVTCPRCNQTFCSVHVSRMRTHQCSPTSP